ncbi:MAG: DUF2461 domain-containing protein [Cytophagaceae bacterium]
MDFKPAFKFLKDLKSNNNKEWFDRNKDRYLAVKKDFEGFVEELIHGISSFDREVGGVDPKKCIFRIYRDVRFSKDKIPYKVHMGAYIAAGGAKSPKAGYYFHLEPGKNLVAGGLWMPEPPVLNSIRQAIDYDAKPLLKIINSKSFKNAFGEIEGEKLSRPPKGFDAEHPQIELIKHKSFNVMHPLSDVQINASGFKKELLKIYKEMKPLNDYLNSNME